MTAWLAAGWLAATTTLVADLPDDVLAKVGAHGPDAPADVLGAVLRAAHAYEFRVPGVRVLTDRRWFRVESVEGVGAPALEVRRWPGDTVVAFYPLPAHVAPGAAIPGLTLSGVGQAAGPCSVRDGKLETGALTRAVVWADCVAGTHRVGALGVPGDAGFGVKARGDLRHEIVGVLAHLRVDEAPPLPVPVLPPQLPVPPAAADERRDAWQVFRGDGFTLGLPPGMRAIKLDGSVPPPRPLPQAVAWMRGRFTDRDGTAVAVGDGRRAGYVAFVEEPGEAWRAGVEPPLGASGADRLDEAELHDLVKEWTGATKAVVSHWKEPGFAGDWLVFRLHLRGPGVEIGLPVLSGWRSLALFWIPVTWRAEDRPPAPPPIDPAVGLGVRFDRFRGAQRSRQPLTEGTLVVGTLRVEIPRGYWPVANLGSPDGLPVAIYDAAGAVAGRLEAVRAADVPAAIGAPGFTAQPRPGSRKAASIHRREDGACLMVSRSGGGYRIVPEPGGRERAEAWSRLVESASFVKAARREDAPGRASE